MSHQALLQFELKSLRALLWDVGSPTSIITDGVESDEEDEDGSVSAIDSERRAKLDAALSRCRMHAQKAGFRDLFAQATMLQGRARSDSALLREAADIYLESIRVNPTFIHSLSLGECLLNIRRGNVPFVDAEVIVAPRLHSSAERLEKRARVKRGALSVVPNRQVSETSLVVA